MHLSESKVVSVNLNSPILIVVSNAKGGIGDGQISVQNQFISFKFWSKMSTNIGCPPD